MRTKEEIINHVHYVGYGKKAMKEICAFMVGAGLKEKAEVIQFKIGEGSFNDFYEWFLLDSERKIIVETLNKVNDIFKSAIEREAKSWSEVVDNLINAFDKPAFKKGDYITTNNGSHIIIVEEIKGKIISAFAYYYKLKNMTGINYNVTTHAGLYPGMRPSTSEEIKEMDEALARDGKYFDKETLEIKDILKEGDIVIVWDNNNKRAIICVYRLSLKNAWNNIVKFESIEQYKKILKGEN